MTSTPVFAGHGQKSLSAEWSSSGILYLTIREGENATRVALTPAETLRLVSKIGDSSGVTEITRY
jgi:hypothetical protein